MVHQVTRFSDAFSAWENWNLTDFDSKCECLLALKSLLENSMPRCGKSDFLPSSTGIDFVGAYAPTDWAYRRNQ